MTDHRLPALPHQLWAQELWARRPRAGWDVLIRDHHEGYIEWAEFERNQQTLAANAYGRVGGAKSGRGGAPCSPACDLRPLRMGHRRLVFRTPARTRRVSLRAGAPRPRTRSLHEFRRLTRRRRGRGRALAW